MKTKKVDDKGRVTLGSHFANQKVIVEEVDATEVRVILAKAIPQRELWLHKNRKAMASVLRGLKEARLGIRANPPDLKADAPN